MQLIPEERQKLVAAARTAMGNAYAPYSNFHVGAAVLTDDSKIFSGCNVENASYGLTNCAERTAIFSAVAQVGPKLRLRAVAVVNNREMPCSPCGACRQVIFQFGPEAVVIFQGSEGLKQASITELLPESFKF